ncbi:hypothetical protein MTO96_002209 [Rhipicephalus appendiculatus]
MPSKDACRLVGPGLRDRQASALDYDRPGFWVRRLDLACSRGDGRVCVGLLSSSKVSPKAPNRIVSVFSPHFFVSFISSSCIFYAFASPCAGCKTEQLTTTGKKICAAAQSRSLGAGNVVCYGVATAHARAIFFPLRADVVVTEGNNATAGVDLNSPRD